MNTENLRDAIQAASESVKKALEEGRFDVTYTVDQEGIVSDLTVTAPEPAEVTLEWDQQ